MKVCRRAVNWLQIINAEGDARVCGWMKKNLIGNIIDADYSTLINGEKAADILKTFQDGSFAYCDADNCPFLSNGNLDDIYIDIETLPDYPDMLLLGYEGNCNYSCTCCTSYQHMKDTKENDYTEQYEKLESRLRELMPYVKNISANGRGELFASPRTMKLLAEWKPIAPPEQVTVALETNGSLFNEKNWGKIANLGKYNLHVSITVMSFNEMVYQHLSGTRLPISNIENNLRYVKKLREEGVINYLELATVLQEENFREMPEFARRCIEEFGADKVRIRPIVPGGIYDKNIQWFMDVRNPYHPYYEQYVEVMKSPIFKDPKVLLWSADLASNIGMGPLEKSKQEVIMSIINQLMNSNKLYEYIAENVCKTSDNLYLYGFSAIAKTLILLNESEKRMTITGLIDRNDRLNKYRNIDLYNIESEYLDKNGTVLVTVYNQYEHIKADLRGQGFKGNIIDVYKLIDDYRKCKA